MITSLVVVAVAVAAAVVIVVVVAAAVVVVFQLLDIFILYFETNIWKKKFKERES